MYFFMLQQYLHSIIIINLDETCITESGHSRSYGLIFSIEYHGVTKSLETGSRPHVVESREVGGFDYFFSLRDDCHLMYYIRGD